VKNRNRREEEESLPYHPRSTWWCWVEGFGYKVENGREEEVPLLENIVKRWLNGNHRNSLRKEGLREERREKRREESRENIGE
jgi:hypothetical protein